MNGLAKRGAGRSEPARVASEPAAAAPGTGLGNGAMARAVQLQAAPPTGYVESADPDQPLKPVTTDSPAEAEPGLPRPERPAVLIQVAPGDSGAFLVPRSATC